MTSAQEAMARADQAHDKIDAHEDLCAERYAHIRTTVSAVEAKVGQVISILAWGGGLLATIVVSLIAFLAVRSITDNDDEIKELKAELERARGEVHSTK